MKSLGLHSNSHKAHPAARRSPGLVQPLCSRPFVTAWAGKGTKGGGGKGGKQSKLAGLLEKKKQADDEKLVKDAAEKYRDPEIINFLLMTVNSYKKHTGKFLIETDFSCLADALFNAPFVLVAHNRFQEGVKDPVFVYSNRAGLELWEATWDELVGLPSRKSAPEVQTTQTDRNHLLDKAADSGVVYGYSGWRVSLGGKKFFIKDVTLFNVEDMDGDKIGQAAVFDRYETEHGKEVVVQGFQQEAEAAAAAAKAAAPPSVEDIEKAQEAVAKWAEYVRSLKEVQGLTNKDPQVQEAVQNLQAWKGQLTALQKRLEDFMAEAKAAFDDEDE